MKKIFLILFCLLAAITVSNAQNANKSGKKQFLYLLRLEKAMYGSAAWTPEKKQFVAEHFARLQKMLADGSLILAGRTQTDFDKTIGIAIYEADSFDEAKKIALDDPAVKANIMTVEVYPYEVALTRCK